MQLLLQTWWSSHQMPAEGKHCFTRLEFKLDSSFHCATHCMCWLLSGGGGVLQPSLLLFHQLMISPHFRSFTSEHHLISLYLPFSAAQLVLVPVSAADSIICRSHTDALALFPQQRALWKCQVGLFTCPLLPLALLLWKHTHLHGVWIVLCLLSISWFKAKAQVQGLSCLVCTEFRTALQCWQAICPFSTIVKKKLDSEHSTSYRTFLKIWIPLNESFTDTFDELLLQIHL